MLTPQEVSTHVFTRATIGGYNMTMVDEFLDELTDDYTALYKENAALKAKMKVLVEKVEDYRATEDSMRATLLTAQKMADSIVREAEQKRDEMMAEATAKHDTMIAQAENAAYVKIGQLQQKIAETEARLQQGQAELARFIAVSEDLCNKQLQLLKELPALEVSAPAVQMSDPAPAEESVPAVAEEIEEHVKAAFQMETLIEEEPAVFEEPAAPVEASAEMESDPFAVTEVDFAATRRINISDLQFGRNYNGDK